MNNDRERDSNRENPDFIYYPVNFKEVWSTDSFTIYSPSTVTIKTFMEKCNQIISNKIGTTLFEIVVAGQYDCQMPHELAPALSPSDIRMDKIWGHDLSTLSLYIRRTDHVYPQMINYRSLLVQTIGECPVCLETPISVYNRYHCAHNICTPCFTRCFQLQQFNCPLCRSVTL